MQKASSILTSSRFLFYALIILSIVIIWFVWILIGLMMLVGTLAFFTWKSRSRPKASSSVDYPAQSPAMPVQKETINHRGVTKSPCKYCGTLNDPVRDKNCSGCGAPLT